MAGTTASSATARATTDADRLGETRLDEATDNVSARAGLPELNDVDRLSFSDLEPEKDPEDRRGETLLFPVLYDGEQELLDRLRQCAPYADLMASAGTANAELNRILSNAANTAVEAHTGAGSLNYPDPVALEEAKSIRAKGRASLDRAYRHPDGGTTSGPKAEAAYHADLKRLWAILVRNTRLSFRQTIARSSWLVDAERRKYQDPLERQHLAICAAALLHYRTGAPVHYSSPDAQWNPDAGPFRVRPLPVGRDDFVRLRLFWRPWAQRSDPISEARLQALLGPTGSDALERTILARHPLLCGIKLVGKPLALFELLYADARREAADAGQLIHDLLASGLRSYLVTLAGYAKDFERNSRAFARCQAAMGRAALLLCESVDDPLLIVALHAIECFPPVDFEAMLDRAAWGLVFLTVLVGLAAGPAAAAAFGIVPFMVTILTANEKVKNLDEILEARQTANAIEAMATLNAHNESIDPASNAEAWAGLVLLGLEVATFVGGGRAFVGGIKAARKSAGELGFRGAQGTGHAVAETAARKAGTEPAEIAARSRYEVDEISAHAAAEGVEGFIEQLVEDDAPGPSAIDRATSCIDRGLD